MTQNPPGCLPGMTMRAITPAISPRIRKANQPMAFLPSGTAYLLTTSALIRFTCHRTRRSIPYRDIAPTEEVEPRRATVRPGMGLKQYRGKDSGHVTARETR
ncbi:hypothetical protein GCM10017772_17370 [Promicromonospora soli]|uniref:Uncharacterized protein n=1 Tax=Promicromonospora soli TaxID=2035533 RepID=A0A919KS87_9MICO|nr:hypothetical protein GCM10017772_17370 [Promicromonospora soli]